MTPAPPPPTPCLAEGGWLPVGLAAGGWDDAVFVATGFVAGAVVGSFLNVVARRVPAGRSVVAGRSACPACGHAVRPRDNVPILGWLLLGGRCRDCGSPIPVGYLLVELACGAAIAALAIGELVAWRSTGSSLPLVDRVAVIGDWAWLVGWLDRTAIVLVLVAWSLLARAGHVVTWRTTALAAIVLGGAAAVGRTAAVGSAAAPWEAAVQAAVGAAAGWLAGRLLGSPADQRGLVVAGAAGGWPAVAAAATLAAAVRGLRRVASPRSAAGATPPPGSVGDFAVATATTLLFALSPVLGPAIRAAVERGFRAVLGG